MNPTGEYAKPLGTIAALTLAVFLLGVSFYKVVYGLLEGRLTALSMVCFAGIAAIVALLGSGFSAPSSPQSSPADEPTAVNPAPPQDNHGGDSLHYYCWELLDHLTAVNGYAELILDAVPLTSPLRADLVDLRDAGFRSLLSTLALQWVAGMRQPASGNVALNPAILDLHPQLEQVLPAGTSLRLDLDPQSGLVSHDRDLLQLLVALLVVSSPATAIYIKSRPGTITVQGAGHPHLAGLIEIWQRLGGQINVNGETVHVMASIVRDPVSPSAPAE